MLYLRSLPRPAKALMGLTILLSLAACGGSADRTHSIRPPKSEFTGPYPHDFPIHGIDVSNHQGDIDWQAVRASNVKFAYIKATEGGDHVDQRFAQNWAGAKAAGVKHGAYHFVYWCRPWREEMANFFRTVPVERDALPPVLDVEATPESKSCKRRLERHTVIPEIRAMLQAMEQHYGKRPVIYTTVDFFEAILHPSELEDYPIWVRSTKHSPQVRYGKRYWHFWQYQSDGQVAGIKGNVDKNAFRGDHQQWLAFLGN